MAWFVIEAVVEMDLDAFYAAYRRDGRTRPAYHPAMMVALLLYAYARGTRSSRVIVPLEELLAALLERVAEILGADTAAFLLLDETGDTLVPRAARGIEGAVEGEVRIPVGHGFAGRGGRAARDDDRRHGRRRAGQSGPERARGSLAAGCSAGG